jgi:predicted DNA-binding protein with PD1-like motif
MEFGQIVIYKNRGLFMDYRKYGQAYYIRLDRGDEIISRILEICKKENIMSATFSGIGGCSDAEIQTFIPEKGAFEVQKVEGMLELVAMNGNVVTDEENNYYHHTHATFAFKENGEHRMAAGHIKSTTVLYTAEIELRPVLGGVIKRKYDPETGTGFWNFSDEE